jgi:hypothetical protein
MSRRIGRRWSSGGRHSESRPSSVRVVVAGTLAFDCRRGRKGIRGVASRGGRLGIGRAFPRGESGFVRGIGWGEAYVGDEEGGWMGDMEGARENSG